MAPVLKFKYEDMEVTSTTSARDIIRGVRTLIQVAQEAESALGMHPGTYDLHDEYGKIEEPEDLQRALQMAGDGVCVIRIEEHHHIVRLNQLKKENTALEVRLAVLEAKQGQAAGETDKKIESAVEVVKKMIAKTDGALYNKVIPQVEDLVKDMQAVKDNEEKIQEKLGAINISELHDMAENVKEVAEQVKNCVRKVLDLDHRFDTMKTQLTNDCKRAQEEVKDLQRYMQGKLDILLEADGDMRRDVQLLSERLSLTQDDHKLLQDGLSKLANKCAGALEESEELRDLLGQMREETMYVRSESALTASRVHCLEGEATDKWQGFNPGVMYFRRWHQQAKGGDVQLSGDLNVATGRGRLASTGVVLGNDEGLCVADGPCRRFGTPGYWSSYFEIELDEISAAAKGTGGLYVGFSMQSSAEIHAHPRHEFDGWLMGGASKALISRCSTQPGGDDKTIPDTFKVGVTPGEESTVSDALKMLRLVMPPKAKGDIKDFSSTFPAQDLKLKDRIGVLFRCNRDGGATMKIAINGIVRAEHQFSDAPPAEAVGFLTPVIRLAGTGKSAKLFPGLSPPSKLLADLMQTEG